MGQVLLNFQAIIIRYKMFIVGLRLDVDTVMYSILKLRHPKVKR